MQIITVRVENGVIDIDGIQPGTVVHIHDYDITDDDGDDIYEDDDGNTYRLIVLSSPKTGPSEVEKLKAERDARLEELLALSRNVHAQLSILHEKIMHARYAAPTAESSEQGPR